MRILLIDDEELSRKAIYNFLSRQLGHEVTQCDNAVEGLKLYHQTPFPLVITDIRMPGQSGLDLLGNIKASPTGKLTDIVLVTGFGSMESAIQALRAGAYDYLHKPIDVEELAGVIHRVEEHITLLKENLEYRTHFSARVAEETDIIKAQCSHIQQAYSRLVGTAEVGLFSPQMEEIKNIADKLHEDRSVPVLIEGETGTGKDVVARMIHYGKGPETRPLISINCTAIPPTLFETELFGYVEGAFTDARKKGTVGKFDLAQGGTIFLDEIGDLPLEIQPKLLRILEERSFYRVGGIKKIQLDIRIICATNQDLKKKIEEGKFRRDLFYRLNVGRIYMPPLRERKEEIVPLAQMFLEKIAREKKKPFKTIAPESIALLENYDWPGNVRELQNTVERVVLLYEDSAILPHHLGFLGDFSKNPLPSTAQADVFNLPPDGLDLKELEENIVAEVLKKFEGNKTKTAAYLGLTRSALRSKLKNP